MPQGPLGANLRVHPLQGREAGDLVLVDHLEGVFPVLGPSVLGADEDLGELPFSQLGAQIIVPHAFLRLLQLLPDLHAGDGGAEGGVRGEVGPQDFGDVGLGVVVLVPEQGKVIVQLFLRLWGVVWLWLWVGGWLWVICSLFFV